jgi:ubiquinone/menaquinone biosynthesis C-methylase UbiE
VGESSKNANPTCRLRAAGHEAAEDERLSLLESMFDPTSRYRRSFVQPGWRCLEIGAGRGSMALWLAQQVGKKGQVVATDPDVTYLKRLDLPNLDVRRHNLLEDSIETLGLGSFDMVSLRLVLFWLVGRQEEAIRRNRAMCPTGRMAR